MDFYCFDAAFIQSDYIKHLKYARFTLKSVYFNRHSGNPALVTPVTRMPVYSNTLDLPFSTIFLRFLRHVL